MFRVTERAGNRRRIRLVKTSSDVTLRARRVNRRRFRRLGARKFFQAKDARFRVQRGVNHAVWPGISCHMARATTLVQMIRHRQRRERRTGVCVGNFAGTDEMIPPRRIAEENQKRRARCSDDRERHATAPDPQRRHRRTFGDWPAAACIRRSRSSVLWRPALDGKRCPRTRGRRSSSGSGARNSARQNPAPAVARSSRTSRKSEDQNDVQRRKNQQAVSQRYVDKQPQFQYKLQRAVII